MSMPTAGQAAGKQPTDIAVKCGVIYANNSHSYVEDILKPNCTIIVTYDDWSTDVAHYTAELDDSEPNGFRYNFYGDTSNIQIGGGYKAVTDCSEPTSKPESNTLSVLYDGSACLTAGLKTKPVNPPSTASVMQMPTTGAPDGLSSVGMIAAGLGLLAVGIGLAKRERI